jgi:uncharacterized membrane protein
MFETTLIPHRSLSPAGYRLLIACLAAPNGLLALAFLIRGVWPVAVLSVLLVAAIHFAFRRNFAEARRLRERVTLDERDLVIEQTGRDGSVRCRRFNRYWVRVRFEEEDEDTNRLRVGSHGRFVTLGSFLSPDERKRLAGTLEEALRRGG